MKRLVLQLLLVGASFGAVAQDAITYKTPAQAITDLVLAKPTPGTSIDSKAQWILFSERNSLPSVEELAMPELKLAGMRINPNNFSPSRQTYINSYSIKNIKSGKVTPVTGLPSPLYASGGNWSPKETKIAVTVSSQNRIDLYIIDVATAKATKVNKLPLNQIMGGGVSWVDEQTLVYRVAPKAASMAPPKPLAPKGPTVQESLGKAAPSATIQDLIKTPHDEDLFEFYATSQLVQNKAGVETPIGKPAIYSSVSFSPDKQYMMVRTIRKPFSYLVSANGFPTTITIQDRTGKVVKTLAELPSSEVRPSGYDNVQNVPRSFSWRDDVPATVTWAVPLDEGLIKNNVPFHDAVYSLNAPFTGQPKEILKTKWRFGGISWGNANFALLRESSRTEQKSKTSRFNPTTGEVDLLFELNTTDAYNSPGSPVTMKNQYDREVILTLENNSKLLFNNTTGASAKGDLPFLAKFDLNTKKSEILWRAQEGTFEMITDILDPEKLVLLTRKESQTEVPNYYIKNLTLRIADQKITNFENPFKAMEGVTKQKISYKRADGIDLTGDLYLPKGYNKDTDGPLPVLIWAYPREFNSAADAAQIRGSQHRFTSIGTGGPLFFVTQGYAVLDNAEMPIVAQEGKRPNDTFVPQLKLNAEAAINKLVELGVGDRNRMAVGGHSYGAFMTANLLAHTNLFKAGIARSGAYNRTLTPFGFQNEDRTYWQAPQLYYEMSPFSYANQIKTPILLIHGEMDDNQGTFPMNSERLFNAIKGHGGITRFVYLPYEAHGYRAKENILHQLWEINTWLDTYVKNPKK
ncbi:MAG: S9 family peptidase [Pedobacter sp.]|nr:MAG: S9 family peptidase [Pedobacter sp.]